MLLMILQIVCLTFDASNHEKDEKVEKGKLGG
jgi:hypothetical protein